MKSSLIANGMCCILLLLINNLPAYSLENEILYNNDSTNHMTAEVTNLGAKPLVHYRTVYSDNPSLGIGTGLFAGAAVLLVISLMEGSQHQSQSPQRGTSNPYPPERISLFSGILGVGMVSISLPFIGKGISNVYNRKKSDHHL